MNLLIYNVAGGGESHLYGTEGPLYYLKNGFNNFNVCFVLAMLFLAILPIAKKKYAPDLLIVISPLYIWLGFMSLQPHKEERFGKIFYTVFFYKFKHIVLLYVMRLKCILISCFHNYRLIQVWVLLYSICNIASPVVKELGTLLIGGLACNEWGIQFLVALKSISKRYIIAIFLLCIEQPWDEIWNT